MGGGDKCLLMLEGRTLLDHVVDRARPQVSQLLLNAGGDPDRFAHTDLPVVADVVGGFAGPLAGVLTGLTWAREHAPGCAWVASFATDTPFLPGDLVARLADAVEGGAELACAASGGRSHPVFGLWPVRLCDALRDALVREDVRKIDTWTARYRLATVPFPTEPFDPFFNVNAPEDLETATRLTEAPCTT